ncbi:MAG: SAM-dependent methyltransferase [Chthoniobacterales bacterium]
MGNVKLTPEVTAILRASTISGNLLFLPSGQLDRKMYEAVNKAIVMAGGKWMTNKKAHVFDGDPLVKLGIALETGVVVDEKNERQAFYTLRALAMQIAQMAMVAGEMVLEPSAGGGALADACMEMGAKDVLCIEIHGPSAEALKARYKVRMSDFLSCFPVNPSERFTRIVMNPPFTRNQDIAHVEHALKVWLAPGGVLVSVMAPNTSRARFQKLIANIKHEIEEVECGAFKESGTDISTIILRVIA